MNMSMEDAQSIEVLDPAILDFFWLDAYKPKLCDEKDVLVVAFFTGQAQVAEELQRCITGSPADIIAAEASSQPDEDGFYIVIVELDRQKTMYNELTVLLESIEELSRFDTWYFKPFDYNEYFEWNEINFAETVPQDPQSFKEQQLDINVTADAADSIEEIQIEQSSDQSAENQAAIGLSALSRSLNSELRKQFGHLIKLNQRLLRKFDKLQTDHKYLQRQLKLYQKREKLALMRERQDLQRIRRLEGELSMLAYSSAGQRDVVIAESRETVGALTDTLTEEMHFNMPETASTDDPAFESQNRDDSFGPSESDNIPSDVDVEAESEAERDSFDAPVDADESFESENIPSDAETEAGSDSHRDSFDRPTDNEEVIDLEDPLEVREEVEPASENADEYESSNGRSQSKAMHNFETIGDGTEAAGSFDDAQGSSEDAPSSFAKGMRALKAKHYDEAIDNFSKVEADSEEAARAYYNLAVLFYMRKNFEAANHYAELAFLGGVQSAEQILEFSREKQQELQEQIQSQEAESPQPQKTVVTDSPNEHGQNPPEADEIKSSDQPVADVAESVAAGNQVPDAHGQTGVEDDLDAYYYALGQAALEKNDIATAIDYFSAIEDSAHQAPISRYYLAILYMRTNMYDQARHWAVRARDMGVGRANKIIEMLDERGKNKRAAEPDTVPDRKELSKQALNVDNAAQDAEQKRSVVSDRIPESAVGTMPDRAAEAPAPNSQIDIHADAFESVVDKADESVRAVEPAFKEDAFETRAQDIGIAEKRVPKEAVEPTQEQEEGIEPQRSLNPPGAIADTTATAAPDANTGLQTLPQDLHKSANIGRQISSADNVGVKDSTGEAEAFRPIEAPGVADDMPEAAAVGEMVDDGEHPAGNGKVGSDDIVEAADAIIKGPDSAVLAAEEAQGRFEEKDLKSKTEMVGAIKSEPAGTAVTEEKQPAANADAARASKTSPEPYSREHDDYSDADDRLPNIDDGKGYNTKILSGNPTKPAVATQLSGDDGEVSKTSDPGAVGMNRQYEPELSNEAVPGLDQAAHAQNAGTQPVRETQSTSMTQPQNDFPARVDEQASRPGAQFEDEASLADVYDVLVGSTEDTGSDARMPDNPPQSSDRAESPDTKIASSTDEHANRQNGFVDQAKNDTAPLPPDDSPARTTGDDHAGPARPQTAGQHHQPAAADHSPEIPPKPVKPQPKPLDPYLLAKRALKQKKYKQAIKHLSAIDRKSPQAPNAQYMLSCIYYRMKRTEEAASHAQLALDMGIFKARSLLDKIKTEMLKKLSAKTKSKGVKKPSTKAATAAKASEATKQAAETDGGIAAEKERLPVEATAEAVQAVEPPTAKPEESSAEQSAPALVDARSNASTEFAALSADGVDDYLSQFQDAPLDDEYHPTETFAVSDAYDFFNDVQDEDTYGSTTFDQLIENKNDLPDSQPDAETEPDYFTLGKKALGQKDYNDALKNFLQAGTANPNDPRVHYNLAVTYYRLKNYTEARQSARIAYRGGVKAAQKVLQNIDRQLNRDNAPQSDKPKAKAVAAAPKSQSADVALEQQDSPAQAILEPTDTQTIGDSVTLRTDELEEGAFYPEGGLTEEKTMSSSKGEVMAADQVSDPPAKPPAPPQEATAQDASNNQEEDLDYLELEATDFDVAPPPVDLSGITNPEEINKYLTLGQKAVDKKDYLRAIKHFTKITDLLPKDPLGFYNLAIISYRLKYYTTAKAHAQKAVDLGLPAAQKILDKIISKQF